MPSLPWTCSGDPLLDQWAGTFRAQRGPRRLPSRGFIFGCAEPSPRSVVTTAEFQPKAEEMMTAGALLIEATILRLGDASDFHRNRPISRICVIRQPKQQPKDTRPGTPETKKSANGRRPRSKALRIAARRPLRSKKPRQKPSAKGPRGCGRFGWQPSRQRSGDQGHLRSANWPAPYFSAPPAIGQSAACLGPQSRIAPMSRPEARSAIARRSGSLAMSVRSSPSARPRL